MLWIHSNTAAMKGRGREEKDLSPLLTLQRLVLADALVHTPPEPILDLRHPLLGLRLDLPLTRRSLIKPVERRPVLPLEPVGLFDPRTDDLPAGQIAEVPDVRVGEQTWRSGGRGGEGLDVGEVGGECGGRGCPEIKEERREGEGREGLSGGDR